jgi:hypothetical protein
MKFPRTDAALEEQSMNNDLENRTGVRRQSLHAVRSFVRLPQPVAPVYCLRGCE